MKQFYLFLIASLSMSCVTFSQISVVPAFPTMEDTVTIFYDATQGNAALINATPVFAHTGVITNLSTSPSDWKYVKTTWATSNAASQMEQVSPNIWKKKIHIRSFYGIPANETATKLAFVFRDAGGIIVGRAADGGDIFYDIFPNDGKLRTKFFKPFEPFSVAALGQNFDIFAGVSKVANLELYDNDVLFFQKNDSAFLNTNILAKSGFHKIKFVAFNATQADSSFFSYLVPQATVIENPPIGTRLGATILSPGNLRLRLDAPAKTTIYVIGNFNNWTASAAYQMKKSTDGTAWWLDISGIDFTQPIEYQYFVDGNIKIADPLSELVLDAGNDNFIDAATFPNKPPYPTGKTTGHVSLLRPSEPNFNWVNTNFTKPKKTDLVIYELLLRDFVATHNYQTLLDTLDYLQNLGINAIELMPVNEFDGNINWGYSPSFHAALDKFYGDPKAFKTLIDECHTRGIAIILDVVFNHATGDSPLAKLYWDGANSRPAADNPWLNPISKHPFNVYNDVNHESQLTKDYVERCLAYWIDEYRVDGFRFDLSKGFTQVNSGSNVGAWGNYDASRIAILKNYGAKIWAKDPNSFVILEHFADNSEEKELSNNGFMFWGNMSGSYKSAAVGSTGAANDLSYGSYKARGWASPNLVTYSESHDEERIGHECKTNGNSANANHNVKNLNIATRRRELCDVFLYTIPGPKMIWQFGEMGYDYSINYCENGTINNGCRTDPKPIKWDFLQNAARKHLHDVDAALIKLRISEDIFETTNFSAFVATGSYKTIVLKSPTDNAVIVGNFSVNAGSTGVTFPHLGKWFDFFTGDSLDLTNVSVTMPLAEGQYRLWLDKKVISPTVAVRDFNPIFEQLEIFPNPAKSEFVVGFSLKNNANLRLELLDLTGKSVQIIAQRAFAEGDNYLETNVENHPNGLYFLKITDDLGHISVKKVMIAR
jgi:Alpha amylase, catalytic domain/Secretion system C-terminal sorting domain